MALPKHIVEEVRSRTDIAEVVGRTVTLKRAGRNMLGLCPFHNEKTPSFNVIPEKGIYHCFGCGVSGDVISFVQRTAGLSFIEAVKELAAAVGVVIEERELSPEEHRRIAAKADLYDVVEAAARFYEETLLVRPEGAAGRAYLAKRGIITENARKYRLGYAPEGWDKLSVYLQRQRIPMELALKAGVVKKSERSGGYYDVFRGRVTFVIPDEKGRPVAFGGRLLPEIEKAAETPGPKYLNSPESEIYEKSKTLYGLWWARSAIQRKDRVVLVEGYFDAISLWQSGVEEAVATCGTALTPAHLERIKRLTRKAVALFDSDEAGIRAAMKSMELFLDAGVEARRMELTGAKDPDEYIQKFGSEAFDALLQKSEPLIEMVIRRTVEREGGGPDGKVRALEALLPVLRRLPEMLQDQIVGLAAQVVGLRVEEVQARLGAAPQEAPIVGVQPTKWVPAKELSHLIWLVIYYPILVAPEMMAVEPSLITEREEVLTALARLCGGASLPDVIASISDDDVSRVFMRISAQPELYSESQAVSATKQILARMELAHVESKIALINARLNGFETRGATSSPSALATEISTLYARRVVLRGISSRRG